MPYIADAVPGWFQATLTLYDSHGKEVAYADDFRFNPDPVLQYEVPADGDYVLEVKDAIYRGREDFVYRISMGELPRLTSIFPLGGRVGSSTEIEVTGWNIPARKVSFDTKDRAAGVYGLAVPAAGVMSNRLPFAVGELPEVFEKEGNDTQREAQGVTLPVTINGRIGQPGDRDIFSFKGRAGDVVVAEVTARRLESPFDSMIELTDESGRRIAFNDDHEDRGSGLATHHADSYINATLPANGTYFVRIGDVQRKGGPEYAYRLRISAPQPDYELRVSPSSINAVAGATLPVTVSAVRRDGFDGDIQLSLRGVPPSFHLAGGVIPAGLDEVRVTLTIPQIEGTTPLSVRLEGRATINGREVTRPAVPAEDRTQAFAYHHLVPTDELRVFVTGRGGNAGRGAQANAGRPAQGNAARGNFGNPAPAVARIITQEPVRIPTGGSTQVRVAIPPAYSVLENLQFELSDPPDGLTLGNLSIGALGAQFVLIADSTKLKPGLRGNVIVNISGDRRIPPNAQNPNANRRLSLGTLPAISFEVVKGR